MKRSKEKTILRILLIVFTLIGIIFSIYLVVSEIYNPGFCPRIFNIPACYLVITSFGLVLISLFINRIPARLAVFYIGVDFDAQRPLTEWVLRIALKFYWNAVFKCNHPGAGIWAV